MGLVAGEKLIINDDTSEGFPTAVETLSSVASNAGAAAAKWPFAGGVNARKYVLPESWDLNLFGNEANARASKRRAQSAVTPANLLVTFTNQTAWDAPTATASGNFDSHQMSFAAAAANDRAGVRVNFVNEGYYQVSAEVIPMAAFATLAGVTPTVILGTRQRIGFAAVGVSASGCIHAPIDGFIDVGFSVDDAARDNWGLVVKVTPIEVSFPYTRGFAVRQQSNTVRNLSINANSSFSSAMSAGTSFLDLGDVSLASCVQKAFTLNSPNKYTAALQSYINNPATGS